MSRLHRALASIVFCLSACGVAAAQQPQLDQLRLIAPAAPGGGWDQTARVMQQVLQRTGIVRTAPVENIPGAAGTIGLARFVGSEQGRRRCDYGVRADHAGRHRHASIAGDVA